MRTRIKLIILLSTVVLICTAQDSNLRDKELLSLMDLVKTLRSGNEKAYNKAVAALRADKNWTTMNETGNLQKSECRPSDNVPGFKLNRILVNAERNRKHVSTHGDMLNGEDSRFHYSLYERSLKKGGKATYTLRGRSGVQTFILVPFLPQKGCLTATINGKVYKQDQSDGTMICPVSSNMIKSDEKVTITVENKSGGPLAFAIINHNSRKK